jgi:hypothetical protein
MRLAFFVFQNRAIFRLFLTSEHEFYQYYVLLLDLCLLALCARDLRNVFACTVHHML